MTSPDRLARDYRSALLGAVGHRSEVTLHRGYQLGRKALADGISVLELARTHHECLVEVLRDTPPSDVPAVAVAASEFFLEILATMDMAQRAYLEGRRAEGEPGREAGQGSRPGHHAGRRPSPPPPISCS